MVCSTANGASITSGGGFSTLDAAPSWQAPFISNYFKSLPASQIPPAGYSTTGRGYPDVSLVAHSFETVINGTLTVFQLDYKTMLRFCVSY